MRAPERNRALRAIVAACSFLTRVPLGRAAGAVTEDDLRAGAAWFPVVGGCVGLLVATVSWLVVRRAPAGVAAVVATAFDVGVTGAFHLDGLADTADGLGAASTGLDGLSVMRDPAIGAFGASALVLDLALRIAAIAAVLARPGFPWAIVAAGAAARVAPLVLARRLRYVRPEGGTGSWVGEGPSATTVGIGVAFGIAIAATAGPAQAAAVLLSVAVVTLAIAVVSRRAFGGVTGDVFGAAAELSQTIALATVVVVAGR